MWVLSPCDDYRSHGAPMLIASLFTGRQWPEGARSAVFDASLTLTVWPDGYLEFWNGDYPWCRSLGEPALGEVEAAMDSIRRRSIDLTPDLVRLLDEHPGDTVVWVQIQEPAAGNEPPSRGVIWSPSLKSDAELVAGMDDLFCALERSTGSGYEHQIESHFKDFLGARGRTSIRR